MLGNVVIRLEVMGFKLKKKKRIISERNSLL